MQPENQKEGTSLNIDIDEKTAGGVYSNLVIVNHSDAEFVLDFAAILPGISGAKVQSRVILTPENAKRLLEALKDNIQKFETFEHQSEFETGVVLSDIPDIPGLENIDGFPSVYQANDKKDEKTNSYLDDLTKELGKRREEFAEAFSEQEITENNTEISDSSVIPFFGEQGNA